MPDYRVRWEIDIDARTPQEAAEKARAVQIRQGEPDAHAGYFEVMLRLDADEFGPIVVVDLTPEGDDA
jgi:hypothetical protein